MEGWRSEHTQFLRIFDLRAELLSYKRLLRLLVPPSLAPALLDKAYRESRGDGGDDGGGGGGKKGGGGTSGAASAGGGEPGGIGRGAKAGTGGGDWDFGKAAPSDGRFAERFDEASVLSAEGGAKWLPPMPPIKPPFTYTICNRRLKKSTTDALNTPAATTTIPPPPSLSPPQSTRAASSSSSRPRRGCASWTPSSCASTTWWRGLKC